MLDLPLSYEDVDEDWNLEHQPPEPIPGDHLPPSDDDRVVRVLTRSVFTSIGANSPRLCLVTKTGMLDSGANCCITNRLDVLVDVCDIAPESSIPVFVNKQSHGEFAPIDVKTDLVKTLTMRSSSTGGRLPPGIGSAG